MPPTAQDRMQDVLEAIEEIDDILLGVQFSRFDSDRRMRLLIERLLEIVCEASRFIPENVKQEGPKIDWRRIVDFGNLLRHAYHKTRAEIVWDVIQDHLPSLKEFVRQRIPGKV